MTAISKGALVYATPLCGLACDAATIEGRVVGVADGDTVTVLDADKTQHRLRLSGMDAPGKRPTLRATRKAIPP